MPTVDRVITLVHSSDIHIDGKASESFHPLCKVVDTAVRLHADVLLLAGDVFDHNRLPLEQIAEREYQVITCASAVHASRPRTSSVWRVTALMNSIRVETDYPGETSGGVSTDP